MKNNLIGFVLALFILPSVSVAGYYGWPTAYNFAMLKLNGVVVATVDDVSTKLDAADYTAADVLTKIQSVDGPGSGIDADKIDGNEGYNFIHVFDSITYNPLENGTLLTVKSASIDYIHSDATVSGLRVEGTEAVDSQAFINFFSGSTYPYENVNIGFDSVTDDFYIGGGSVFGEGVKHKFWHAGNDGVGSGLDAGTVGGVSVLTGNVTHDFGTHTAGALKTVDITVTGAAVNSTCGASPVLAPFTSIGITCHVLAADTVTLVALNNSSSEWITASETYYVTVFNH